MDDTIPLLRGNRRSIRLNGYDYTQAGAYFVTLCVRGRKCLFGQIHDEAMVLNRIGQMVQEEWIQSANIRREIELDVFVVMPNHLHGIVVIANTENRDGNNVSSQRKHISRMPIPPASQSLGAFIAGFKASVTKRYNCLKGGGDGPVWQRNYHDHIIRNEEDLRVIREYVAMNPICWEKDGFHPVFGG